MGSLCFSSPSILRCASFTSLQSQLLIIPTALELLFTASLVYTNWGAGSRRHLLLTAEGCSYFALALLELLSHTLPAVRDSVKVFTVVDIILGATSFLPIFFYTLFIYLFTRGKLLPTLPKSFQRVANVLLVIFLPAIVALNELSSFVGISRRTIPLGSRSVVAIGFRAPADQQLWTFFTSLALALLTAFQAINFCFAFYRLVRAFVDQRRIEATTSVSGEAQHEVHHIRGIGYITAGLKLGAIETVVGFAPAAGFGGALVRRIIRFVARALLVVGVAKGMDELDDFSELTNRVPRQTQQRRSRLGLLISNPRFSTFRQLSPNASEFHAGPQQEKLTFAKPDMSDFERFKREAANGNAVTSPTDGERSPSSYYPSNNSNSNSTDIRNANYRGNQRVTVMLTPGIAPTLHMRFSGLEMPSPAVIVEKVKSRPVSQDWVSVARSSLRYATSVSSRYAAPSTAGGASFAFPPVPVPAAAAPYKPAKTAANAQHARGISQFSTRSSGYPDTISAVRELADQFPGLPPPTRKLDDVEAQRQRAYAPAPQDPFHNSNAVKPSKVADADASSPEPVLRYAYGGMEHYSSPEEALYPALPNPHHNMMSPEESPEPMYQYSYDAPDSSPERIIAHPYANPALGMGIARGGADYNPQAYEQQQQSYFPPQQQAYEPREYQPQHRQHRSDTTMGTTPNTYLSRFTSASASSHSSSSNHTAGDSDPFVYDGGAALKSGMSMSAMQQQDEYDEYAEYAVAQREPVYAMQAQVYTTPQIQPVNFGESPARPRPQHNRADSEVVVRTSAALLQMTQRGDGAAHEAWTPPEFTPSMFSIEPESARSAAPSVVSSSSKHNTLRKKRRPSTSKSRERAGSDRFPHPAASVDTLASSWLHGDLDADAEGADDEQEREMRSPRQQDVPLPVRVKTVGRVRAPRKNTPTPVSVPIQHKTRGSIYIQPITVPPPSVYASEVQIVQGGMDSANSDRSGSASGGSASAYLRR
ncbi:hypothetical protein C8J57DRAFT_231211 [Mycena rebaudengoi]|nr:hypothetical protein C8J57DRAFT_231211 [Mycena rebaudengoi]